MNLLYIFPEEFTGRFAREYHVYRLAESLAASGGAVTLAAAPSDKISSTQELHALFGGTQSPRLKIAWISRKMSLGPFTIRSGAWYYKQLDRLIESLKPDAVYTMHLKAADHIAKKHPALPLIFEAHEIFADSYADASVKRAELLQLQQRIHAHARATVAISRPLASSLVSRLDVRSPIHVQHDGIDESMLLDLSVAPDPHELIYAGSLQAWKGVPVAIAAMKLLPKFHLTVLGGDDEALERIRRDAPANVTFHGTVPRKAMHPYLARARIGLMPNLLEPRSALSTFPLKLLEYSAAGKGIVASRIPVFDSLEIGAWTELVPSGDVAALADGVRALAQRGIDRAAAQAWARQFLWPNQGVALKSFLEDLL